jgi:hypothetical protein
LSVSALFAAGKAAGRRNFKNDTEAVTLKAI